MNTINDRIRYLADLYAERTEGGKVNKSAFARKCGIEQSTMAGYILGKSTPTIESIVKISESNNISLVWLITGKGEEQPTINATNPINSFNDIKDNEDCNISLIHTTNQKPQRGRRSIDLSEKEERIVLALRKIGKDDYTDGLLERVESAAKALTW